MKKLLYIVPLLLGMTLTSCYNEEFENINSRLDAIENTQIATISQQITSINNSIQLLTNTDAELKGYIATLEAKAEALESEFTDAIATEKAAILAKLETINATIIELKAKDSALEGQIAGLKTYVDTQLKEAEDWATATFATLELYNALANDVAALKTYVEGVKGSLTASITALETSMKEWVNEQLAGYYTIAEIDAKIKALEDTYTKGKEDVENDITSLQAELSDAKSELTKGYQDAITEAINSNNGMIDSKIAAEIATVNEKIAGLEKRVDEIESRLSAVEDAIEQIKALDITFDTTEKACMPGASVYIGYTITGGDAETTIEAWGDGGWSASVICKTAIVGTIKISAPIDATSGKVVVLVTSGAGGVKMKSLHFVEGILSNIRDTYEVVWEACSLKIDLKTNLNYTVNIPVEAQGWINLAQTRTAIRNETLTFSIAENPEEMVRSATLEIVGECGDVLQSFEIAQKAAPADGYIEFADKYAKLICVEKFDLNGDGEISYKEASKVTSLGGYFFGNYAAAVVSFDELQYFINLSSIDSSSFRGCSNLTSIVIPDSVTKIGEYAFFTCEKLTSATIGKNVISIDSHAFDKCTSLNDITIPQGVCSIGSAAFSECSSLTELVIPDSVTTIGSGAFSSCPSLTTISLSKNLSTIKSSTFIGCSNLTSITVPDSVTTIGDYALQQCSKLSSITIGKGITSIGSLAFSYCPSLTSIRCMAIDPPTIYYNAFSQSSTKRTIYVPTESVWLYQSTKWKNYADDIVGYDFE